MSIKNSNNNNNKYNKYNNISFITDPTITTTTSTITTTTSILTTTTTTKEPQYNWGVGQAQLNLELSTLFTFFKISFYKFI